MTTGEALIVEAEKQVEVVRARSRHCSAAQAIQSCWRTHKVRKHIEGDYEMRLRAILAIQRKMRTYLWKTHMVSYLKSYLAEIDELDLLLSAREMVTLRAYKRIEVMVRTWLQRRKDRSKLRAAATLVGKNIRGYVVRQGIMASRLELDKYKRIYFPAAFAWEFLVLLNAARAGCRMPLLEKDHEFEASNLFCVRSPEILDLPLRKALWTRLISWRDGFLVRQRRSNRFDDHLWDGPFHRHAYNYNGYPGLSAAPHVEQAYTAVRRRMSAVNTLEKWGFIWSCAPGPHPVDAMGISEFNRVYESSSVDFRDCYTVGQVIGEGHYGLVMDCAALSDKAAPGTADTPLVVKLVEHACGWWGKVEATQMTRWRLLHFELAELKKVSHPHLVPILDVFFGEFFVYLVRPKYERSLSETLEKSRATSFNQRYSLPAYITGEISYQMLLAVEVLHVHGFVHRNIKIENFLMNSTNLRGDFKVVLSDSLHGVHLKEGTCLTEAIGCRQYWAPEVIAKAYAHGADMWALGMCVWYAFTLTLPFLTVEETLFKDILKVERMSDEQFSFVNSMLEKEPVMRVTAAEALQVPFLLQCVQRHKQELQAQLQQAGGKLSGGYAVPVIGKSGVGLGDNPNAEGEDTALELQPTLPMSDQRRRRLEKFLRGNEAYIQGQKLALRTEDAFQKIFADKNDEHKVVTHEWWTPGMLLSHGIPVGEATDNLPSWWRRRGGALSTAADGDTDDVVGPLGRTEPVKLLRSSSSSMRLTRARSTQSIGDSTPVSPKRQISPGSSSAASRSLKKERSFFMSQDSLASNEHYNMTFPDEGDTVLLETHSAESLAETLGAPRSLRNEVTRLEGELGEKLSRLVQDVEGDTLRFVDVVTLRIKDPKQRYLIQTEGHAATPCLPFVVGTAIGSGRPGLQKSVLDLIRDLGMEPDCFDVNLQGGVLPSRTVPEEVFIPGCQPYTELGIDDIRREFFLDCTIEPNLSKLRSRSLGLPDGKAFATRNHVGATARFGWWEEKKCVMHCFPVLHELLSPPEFDGYVPISQSSIHRQGIMNVLTEHGVNCGLFGVGNSRTLRRFVLEVQSGETQLYYHREIKNVVRRYVEVISVRIRSASGMWLMRTHKRVGNEGHTDVRHEVPSVTLRAFEDKIWALRRLLRELGVPMAQAKARFGALKTKVVEDEVYPGIETVILEQDVEVQLESLDTHTLRIEDQGASRWFAHLTALVPSSDSDVNRQLRVLLEGPERSWPVEAHFPNSLLRQFMLHARKLGSRPKVVDTARRTASIVRAAAATPPGYQSGPIPRGRLGCKEDCEMAEDVKCYRDTVWLSERMLCYECDNARLARRLINMMLRFRGLGGEAPLVKPVPFLAEKSAREVAAVVSIQCAFRAHRTRRGLSCPVHVAITLRRAVICIQQCWRWGNVRRRLRLFREALRTVRAVKSATLFMEERCLLALNLIQGVCRHSPLLCERQVSFGHSEEQGLVIVKRGMAAKMRRVSGSGNTFGQKSSLGERQTSGEDSRGRRTRPEGLPLWLTKAVGGLEKVLVTDASLRSVTGLQGLFLEGLKDQPTEDNIEAVSLPSMQHEAQVSNTVTPALTASGGNFRFVEMKFPSVLAAQKRALMLFLCTYNARSRLAVEMIPRQMLHSVGVCADILKIWDTYGLTWPPGDRTALYQLRLRYNRNYVEAVALDGAARPLELEDYAENAANRRTSKVERRRSSCLPPTALQTSLGTVAMEKEGARRKSISGRRESLASFTSSDSSRDASPVHATERPRTVMEEESPSPAKKVTRPSIAKPPNVRPQRASSKRRASSITGKPS
eukprot:TRINITY_DN37913_c0_g1_i6.p1 TRINITY_DN37913_c0_g1~~TRINITY_DN37913_c0_g1_i6.p1  ORF type:complete len:1808 (+),score=315.74 TRINITY_DN37913_c0_g1_i6:160-5583(+)